MITFKQRGNFSKFKSYTERIREIARGSTLDRYGQEGVAALAAATPVDSGETANSWYYEIEHNGNSSKIVFANSHVEQGVPISIILQYGHATKNGGWVEGRDYINPAIQPIFDKIANDAWNGIKRA